VIGKHLQDLPPQFAAVDQNISGDEEDQHQLRQEEDETGHQIERQLAQPCHETPHFGNQVFW